MLTKDFNIIVEQYTDLIRTYQVYEITKEELQKEQKYIAHLVERIDKKVDIRQGKRLRLDITKLFIQLSKLMQYFTPASGYNIQTAVKTILIEKAKEYAVGSDRLENFKNGVKNRRITAYQHNWSLQSKHLHSILDSWKYNQMQSHEFYAEKFIDPICYCILFVAMIEDEKQQIELIIERAFDAIKEQFGYTKEQIVSKAKTKEISYARQIFCFVLYHRFGITLKQIGQVLNRNHTTIMFLRDTIMNEIQRNDNTSMDVSKIYKYINEKAV